MEKETEVKTIEVNILCPDCEMVMHKTSKYKLDYQPWIYKCPRCSAETSSTKNYPYLKYVPRT